MDHAWQQPGGLRRLQAVNFVPFSSLPHQVISSNKTILWYALSNNNNNNNNTQTTTLLFKTRVRPWSRWVRIGSEICHYKQFYSAKKSWSTSIERGYADVWTPSELLTRHHRGSIYEYMCSHSARHQHGILILYELYNNNNFRRPLHVMENFFFFLFLDYFIFLEFFLDFFYFILFF